MSDVVSWPHLNVHNHSASPIKTGHSGIDYPLTRTLIGCFPAMSNTTGQIIEGQLFVPRKAAIRGGLILYARELRRKPIYPGMLHEFVEIGATHQPSTVLAFAKKHGPLGICEKHGLPCGHNRQSFVLTSGWPRSFGSPNERFKPCLS